MGENSTLKPIKPSEEDCCNSGCNPCIFDVYEKNFKLWENKCFTENSNLIINTQKYLPFEIISIDQISGDILKITFETTSVEKSVIQFKSGDYFILKGNLNNETLSRSYTPVLNEKLKFGQFQVYFRIYENGKMSRLLKNYKIKDVLHWRGPYNHFNYGLNYGTNSFRNLILIGAGTGIVPLYNLSKEIVENENEETRVKVLGCFQTISRIILREEFKLLSGFWNFFIKYFIAEQTSDRINYNEHVNFEKLNEHLIREELCDCLDALIVICGPGRFNLMCVNVAESLELSKLNVIVLN